MIKKTMFYRLLIVFAAIMVFLSVGSPFAFAATPPDHLMIDQTCPNLIDYPFGLNSIIIDVIGGDNQNANSGYRRFVIDGQSATFTVNFPDGSPYGHCYLSITAFNSDIWKYSMYGAGTITSYNDYVNNINRSVHSENPQQVGTYSLNTTTHTYSRTFNQSFYRSNTSTSEHIFIIVSRYDNEGNSAGIVQSYYPLGVGGLSDTDLSKLYEHMDNNREALISQYNEGVTEIINEGEDLTVSTIDNWVENGLASKLTELAATLSSNAAIFSQNQVSNQENLSRAGTFVNGVFDQFPTGIIAALICFLIILIAVKVVGR